MLLVLSESESMLSCFCSALNIALMLGGGLVDVPVAVVMESTPAPEHSRDLDVHRYAVVTCVKLKREMVAAMHIL